MWKSVSVVILIGKLVGHLSKEDPKVQSIIISEKQKSGWEHSKKHVEVIQNEVKAKVNEEKVDK